MNREVPQIIVPHIETVVVFRKDTNRLVFLVQGEIFIVSGQISARKAFRW